MNRQQWAILSLGLGMLLWFSIFVSGGPEFTMECSETNGQGDCDEKFADFIWTIVWSMFATGFGSILVLTGIILFIMDAAEKPKDESESP